MERAYWLAWSRIPGIGPVMLKRLQGHFGTLTAAWQASPQALRGVEGFGPQTIETVVTARKTCGESQLNPEKLLHEHQHENPCFWTPADTEYPRLLLEIPDPPPILYYRGNAQTIENQGLASAIAIVGTREPFNNPCLVGRTGV